MKNSSSLRTNYDGMGVYRLTPYEYPNTIEAPAQFERIEILNEFPSRIITIEFDASPRIKIPDPSQR